MSMETSPNEARNRWIYTRRVAPGELQGGQAGCQVCTNPITSGPAFIAHFGGHVMVVCDPCLADIAAAAAHPAPAPALVAPLVPFPPMRQ